MYLQKLKEAQIRKKPDYGRPGEYFDVVPWLDHDWGRTHKGALANLEYARTINIFAEVFGKDSIGIFLFEQLLENEAEYLRRLCRFIGVDEEKGGAIEGGEKRNPQLSAAQLERIKSIGLSPLKSLLFRIAPRRVRRKQARLTRALQEGPKATVEIPDDWRSRIEDMTRQGNQELVENWGIPLASYGYPL
jgi:hypothetical protein